MPASCPRRMCLRFVVSVWVSLAALTTAACGDDDDGDDGSGNADAMLACLNDLACNDGNDCTLDQCTDGVCQHSAQLEGEACDDGLACTENEVCTAGVCSGAPLDCGSLSDQCNTGSCDEAMGGCVVTPVGDGASCDDGVFCTEGDSCQAGECTGGGPRDCSSMDGPCAVGVCDETMVACVAQTQPDGTVCDDGLFCTNDDTCTAGVCAGPARDCSGVGDACNPGVCDETGDVCAPAPGNDGGACDDGLFCTVNDTCGGGVCAGSARDCSGAGDTCNTGVCDEGADACAPMPANDGASCDDGLFCTVGDVCGGGACAGSARDCSGAGNACNTGVCNEGSDACVPQPANEGGACNDGLFCSIGDRCVTGVCTPTGGRVCADSDACTSDACDEGGDACAFTPVPPIPGAEGPPGDPTCSDGLDNDCDGDDDGADANCVGCIVAGDCDDGNPCTGNVCTAGVCSNPPLTGPSCNDGLFCTINDACNAGTCTGAPRNCSAAGDQCNAGSCSESTDACVPTPANEGGACNDNLFCTVNDVCSAGVCGGGARDCSGVADACNTGSCNEGTDSCVKVPANGGGACNDGLFCTVSDVCTAGTCGGAARNCSAAGNECNDGVCSEGTDTCVPSPKPNGTACTSLFCATGESCQGGTCSGGTPVTCSDGDSCTADSCNESADMCVNTNRTIDVSSLVSSSSDDGSPSTVCLTAGSGARLVVYTDLRDTLGAPITGASVTIGGGAATASVGQPGVYYREISAPAMSGMQTVTVQATACGGMATLNQTVIILAADANSGDGGTGGCSPTDGNLRVRVIEAETGAPISGASVLLGAAQAANLQHGPDAQFGGVSNSVTNTATTDAQGYASFYDYGNTMAGPVTVTAGAANRAYFTLVRGNAADVVLALPLLHPTAPMTSVWSGSGTVPGGLPTGCTDVDAAVVLPQVDLDFFSQFSVSGLFGAEKCWASGNGIVGTVALPSNLWIPAQSIGPLCLGGSVAESQWSLTLDHSPPNENLVMAMASANYADVQAALGGGGLPALLTVLTFRRIGFHLDQVVSGPATRTFNESETYPNNFTVTYSGQPSQTDVVGVSAGDYSGANGTGNLFLIGADVHEWDTGGATVTIPNSDLNAAGNPAGVRRLAMLAAMYLDPDDAGRTTPPPANRREAVSTILIRGGASAPFGTSGGSTTVGGFLGFAGTTFAAPGTFSWENASTAANAPLYSVHELSVRTRKHLPVQAACQTENEVRDEQSVQWILVKPFGLECGAQECFTLPTLPTGFPRANAGLQQKSGFEQLVGSGAACSGSCPVAGESCVDPDGAGAATAMCMGGAGTAGNPYFTRDYFWRLHLYDLELLPAAFAFNAFRFADRLLYLTHESSNEATFQ